MAEGIVTVVSVLAVTVVFMACVLSIALVMDHLVENMGAEGLMLGALGLTIGAAAGVASGAIIEGTPGWHLGGLIGAAVGISLVYLWQKMFCPEYRQK